MVTEFSPGALRTELVRLRPIHPQDYLVLRSLEVEGELGARWRFRGATPTPEQWVQSMANAMVQFVVESSDEGEPLGLVSMHDVNLQDGHAAIAACSFDLAARRPEAMIGVLLMVEYAFHNWNFRKLYFEVPEYNLDQFGSALPKYLEEEARLKDHIFHAGRYWDMFTLSIFRTRWESVRDRFAPLIGSTNNV